MNRPIVASFQLRRMDYVDMRRSKIDVVHRYLPSVPARECPLVVSSWRDGGSADSLKRRKEGRRSWVLRDQIKTMIKTCCFDGALKKMPIIDTLDALEEHEEHEDDYQTNSN